MEQRAELRAEYRNGSEATREDRARYRDEHRRLSERLRADRALQARGRDASGDLWHDVLGADPEDYEAERRGDSNEGPDRGATG